MVIKGKMSQSQLPLWLQYIQALAVPLLAFFGGFVGVLVTALLTTRRERRKQRNDFRERQLSELYGPLLSLRKHVTARYEFHRKIDSAIFRAADKRSPELRRIGVSDEQISAVTLSDLTKLTDHDRKALEEQFMPDYREMVKLFRENIWLSESSTRSHFEALFEYVVTWELFLQNVITGEVTRHLGQGESKVAPLYADIEQTHDRLREELAAKKRRHRRWGPK